MSHSGASATHAYDPRHPLPRLGLSLAVGAATFAALARFAWPVRVVAAWSALTAVQLALSYWIVATSGPEETRGRASADEPGRAFVEGAVLATTPVSVALSLFLLRRAVDLPRAERVELVPLCLGAVVVSWLLTHTAYAARYARLYFRHDGGLAFPGPSQPQYSDFAYFAFTIGMCFQVSDVAIMSQRMRRTALGHALVSFAYDVSILALALNLAVGP